MRVVVQKFGSSQGITIPKTLLDTLGIQENGQVELVPVSGGIIIKRAGTVPPKILTSRLAAFYGSGAGD